MLPLKWEKSEYKAPLSRARGLGTGGDVVGHWMLQRFTAIANIPLVLWMVCNVVRLRGADHATVTAWLAEPINAIPALLFVLSVFTHAVVGLQVVIEDYIHGEGSKILLLWTVKMLVVALGVASVFSILKIAFGA